MWRPLRSLRVWWTWRRALPRARGIALDRIALDRCYIVRSWSESLPLIGDALFRRRIYRITAEMARDLRFR